MRRLEAPSDFAASTNSFSRSESTWPRMMRATYGQFEITMIVITTVRPGWSAPPRHPSLPEHADARPRPSSRTGNASSTSMTRAMTVSVQPRKKPAIMPIVTPIEHRQAGADERDQQRHAGALEDAREDVAPDVVDAHQVLGARRRGEAERVQRLGRGLVRRRHVEDLADQRPEDRGQDQQDDEAERDERDLVLAKAAPEELQGRASGDRRLAGDDLINAMILGVQQIAARSRTQIDSPLGWVSSPTSPNR